MSNLGDLIDDMWDDADPDASSQGSCFGFVLKWVIVIVVFGTLIYFMK